MGERTEAICPPLNEHEAAMYDRFVTFLIEHEKREELEAEVERLTSQLGTMSEVARANAERARVGDDMLAEARAEVERLNGMLMLAADMLPACYRCGSPFHNRYNCPSQFTDWLDLPEDEARARTIEHLARRIEGES